MISPAATGGQETALPRTRATARASLTRGLSGGWRALQPQHHRAEKVRPLKGSALQRKAPWRPDLAETKRPRGAGVGGTSPAPAAVLVLRLKVTGPS